jgi:hypothetical protein
LIFADTSIAGEHFVLVVAGVIGLAGIFLALLAVIADKRGWPYAWELGFVALLFASLAGIGGLWKISGEIGLAFLGCALVIASTVLIALQLSRCGFKMPSYCQRDHSTNCPHCDRGEKHQRQ